MANIQWVYANGGSWLQLDQRTQVQSENLWAVNAATGVVYSQTFLADVYVNFLKMVLFSNGYEYTIARLTL